jgi:chemotaxis protein MotB
MESSENNWMNIADVMSALMMIFMFISIAFLYQLMNDKEIYKVNLNKALHEEFDKDLTVWKATITDDNIIRFSSPFELGKTDLPQEFKEILSSFFPRYVTLLRSKDFKDEITEIRVEGHTSTGWGDLVDKKKIFLKNMELSQARSSNVLAYCYNLNNTHINEYLSWLQDKLRANGISYSRLLYLDDSELEDKVLSRRVEFRVIQKENDK